MALVTGAATGIGKAIAQTLATDGAAVVVNHNHTPGPAEKVVAGIEEGGGAAIAVAADVTSRSEFEAMVGRLLAEFGRWDILVNNAAVALVKPFSDQSMCPAGRRSVVKMPLGRESGLRPEQGSAPWPGPRARRVLGPPWTVPGLLRWEAWLAATS